jgi:condensin complex subunit 2
VAYVYVGIQPDLKKSRSLQKKNKKTIETNVDHINMSKFDLEYDVDPLFKKNSARFDEGRNGGVNFLTSLMLKVTKVQFMLKKNFIVNLYFFLFVGRWLPTYYGL